MATNNFGVLGHNIYTNLMATNNHRINMTKDCRRCSRNLKMAKFKTDKRQPDGRTVTCRECYTFNKLDKFIRTPEQIESHRNKLKGRKYTLKHRLAISAGQKRAVAEGRHHWKVNDYVHPDQERCQLKTRIWRDSVMSLKGTKCEICSSDKMIHVHHIKGFYEFPDLRFDINNGQVLCISCHMKIHNPGGPKEGTVKDAD